MRIITFGTYDLFHLGHLKILERAKKYGTKDIFVLTARPAESAKAIHEFLKYQGLNIIEENKTGEPPEEFEKVIRECLSRALEGLQEMKTTQYYLNQWNFQIQLLK